MANDVTVELLSGETLPDVLREAANWVEANAVVNVWHVVVEGLDHDRRYSAFIYYCE